MRAEHVPVRQPIVIQAQKQRRILFVVPWGTRTYLGTTDAPYSGDPGRSGVTEQDEAELLNLVARVLPRARLDPRNIVSAWSGVRPLLRDRSGPNTVELSRKHAIVETQSGAIAVVGGKLTTYRAMAEEAVDVVIDRLGDRLGTRRLSACSTAEAPLVPGPPLTAEERNDPILSGLFERHGALARSILAVVREDPTRAAFVVPGLPYRWCEVDWALRYEGVTHLVDLMRRRIPLALTATDRGGSAARSIARALVDARGGSERDVEDELEQYGEWIRLETRREVLVDSQNRSAHHKTARVNQESG
jgi:glycerol-3-phosphate dehydrogenase